MEDMLSKIIEEALNNGASYAEIRYEESYSCNLMISNGEIKRAGTTAKQGLGIRVLADGAFCFASTSGLRDNKLLELAREAVKSAKAISKLKKEKISLADAKPVNDKVVYKPVKNPVEVDLSEKKKLSLKVDNIIRSLDERIASSTVFIGDSYLRKLLLTSDGATIEQSGPRVRLVIMIGAFEAGRQGSYVDVFGAPTGYEYFDKLDLNKIAVEAAKKALRMLKAKPAPSGRFTVITDPDLTGVFSHEAIGHACEADGVIAGESILKDRLGKQVGSELVNICDDPTYPGGWGSYRYDDEGVLALKRMLIEKGILKTYITNREAAAKLGIEANGGARAQDYSHPPIVRMSNTFIVPGDWTFEEMLEDVNYGVYLLGSRGGQVDPAKGTFQFNAKEAFLIEKGEITKPLLDVSLSGLILETLYNIDAVGKDFSLRTGTCGKGGQGVPAGTGGPHIRIRNAVVGGRA